MSAWKYSLVGLFSGLCIRETRTIVPCTDTLPYSLLICDTLNPSGTVASILAFFFDLAPKSSKILYHGGWEERRD